MQSLRTIVTIAVLLAAALATPHENDNNQRLLHGDRVTGSDTPWVVNIGDFDGMSTLACSGVILTEKFVLTVASCVDMYINSPRRVGVYAGSLLSSGHGGSKHQAVAIFRHEQFDFTTKANDIALVEVYPPIPFSRRAYPIALPPPDFELESESMLMVAGFGSDPNENTYDSTTTLKRAETVFANTTECRESYASSSQFITYDTFCTGSFPTMVCMYDHGGPVYSTGVLYGLMKPSLGPCGSFSLPELHTKVSTHVRWIKEKVGPLQ